MMLDRSFCEYMLLLALFLYFHEVDCIYVNIFEFSGAVKELKIPLDLNLTFQLWGGGGGGSGDENGPGANNPFAGGGGGYTTGTFHAPAGSYLYVAVGQGGCGSGRDIDPWGGGLTGGWPNALCDLYDVGGGGGGRSQVSIFETQQSSPSAAIRNQSNILMIAAGGGGGAMSPNTNYGPPESQGRGGGGIPAGNQDPNGYNIAGTQDFLECSPGLSSLCPLALGTFLQGGKSGVGGRGGDGYFGGSTGGGNYYSIVGGGAGGSSYISSEVESGLSIPGQDGGDMMCASGGLPGILPVNPVNNESLTTTCLQLSMESTPCFGNHLFTYNTGSCPFGHGGMGVSWFGVPGPVINNFRNGKNGLVIMSYKFKCPPGSSFSFSSGECVSCSQGAFSDGQEACQLCPAGSYSSAAGKLFHFYIMVQVICTLSIC